MAEKLGVGCLHEASPQDSREVKVCFLLSLKEPYFMDYVNCPMLPFRVAVVFDTLCYCIGHYSLFSWTCSL